MMNTLTESYNVSDGSETTCPYCNIQRDACMAAISSYSLRTMGSIGYCSDEDYDDCPIFLAKLLRGDINYKEEIFPTLRNKGNKKACYI